jgi:hypothetical protein
MWRVFSLVVLVAALDFKSPVASSALASVREGDTIEGAKTPLSEQGNNIALPLSPITLPQAAGAVEWGATSGAPQASLNAGEAPGWSMPGARNRADAVATAGSSQAAGAIPAALDHVGTSPIQLFSFSSPRTPQNPQLSRAKDVCDANADAAATPGFSNSATFTFGPSTMGVDGIASKSREAGSPAADAHHASEVRL